MSKPIGDCLSYKSLANENEEDKQLQNELNH